MTLTQIKPLGLSKPVDLADNEKIRLGTSNDLQIYHSGAASIIANSGTGDLYIQDDGNVIIGKITNAEAGIKVIGDGAVELYHDGNKKFRTYASGVIGDQNIWVGTDTHKLLLGGSADLEIYHDGSHSYIKDSGTGNLILLTSKLNINNADNTRAFIHTSSNDGVELYYDNEKVFETTAAGTKVGRTSSSNSYIEIVTSGGTSGFIYGNSNNQIQLLDREGHAFFKGIKDGAVELYYDNVKKFETTSTGGKLTSSATTNGSIVFDVLSGIRGYVYADNANNIGFLDANADWLVKGTKDAGVELYYDGSKKFFTRSNGAQFNGVLRCDDGNGASGSYATFGDDGDLQIYHDGTNSRIRNNVSGKPLLIQNSGGDTRIETLGNFEVDSWEGESIAKFIRDGGVELYHNNNKKLETESNGATVTGRFRVQDSGNVDLAITDTSANAVAAYIGVKTAGHVEYNCYKSGVGTKYPHVFYGYTEEYARIDTAGIKFNGDTATANALSDYEEGVWTPSWGTYAGSGQTDGTFTYHAQQGQYVKIGRIVTLWFYIAYHEMSAVAVGSYARLKGFPFTVDSVSSSHNGAVEGSTLIFNWQNWKGNSAEDLTGFAHRGHNHVLFGHKTANSINAATPGELFDNSTWGPVGNGTYYLFGQITYVTA